MHTSIVACVVSYTEHPKTPLRFFTEQAGFSLSEGVQVGVGEEIHRLEGFHTLELRFCGEGGEGGVRGGKRLRQKLGEGGKGRGGRGGISFIAVVLGPQPLSSLADGGWRGGIHLMHSRREWHPCDEGGWGGAYIFHA